MAYTLSAGIEVSLDGTTWYKLTDHNRKEIQVSAEIIESAKRMANGKMRKYVIAHKAKISTNWSYVPTKTDLTVDGNKSSAWLDAFYEANVGLPIHVKLISSEIDPVPAKGSIPSDLNYKTSATGSQVFHMFITDYSSTIIHRTVDSDYATMNIEFTEI